MTVDARTLSAASPPGNDLRNAFADEITRLGAADKRVTLLSGDIGNKRTQLKKATAAFAALQTGEGAWRM
jgi:hypothetical protein